MGVINVTPDSFSDGGRYFAVDRAVAQARLQVSRGVDVLDLGLRAPVPGLRTSVPRRNYDGSCPSCGAFASWNPTW